MDERGFVFIVDRLSDVINVSGFKVYPNEVEAVATERPDVAQAAAVAAIDERGDEKVALYVVPAAKEVDVAALLKHCRESLAPYTRCRARFMCGLSCRCRMSGRFYGSFETRPDGAPRPRMSGAVECRWFGKPRQLSPASRAAAERSAW